MNSSIQNMAVVGEELALVFADGYEAFLPLPMLRRACPCAACQGEPDAMGRVIRPRVDHGPGAFQMRSLEQVGGYALQLSWADGHASGIYSYDYLRKLASLPNG